eukprot:TRINITY_DN18039_c0_g1_i1.p1 TRINITY_DN18039_c0_g1~~TRINITY_DN18039_c0_g1_i1.p1  ORF type:complete len:878 (-),score=211.05 TRINITY_DN18039_c0_g1_i1:151-2784(-)
MSRLKGVDNQEVTGGDPENGSDIHEERETGEWFTNASDGGRGLTRMPSSIRNLQPTRITRQASLRRTRSQATQDSNVEPVSSPVSNSDLSPALQSPSSVSVTDSTREARDLRRRELTRQPRTSAASPTSPLNLQPASKNQGRSVPAAGTWEKSFPIAAAVVAAGYLLSQQRRAVAAILPPEHAPHLTSVLLLISAGIGAVIKFILATLRRLGLSGQEALSEDDPRSVDWILKTRIILGNPNGAPPFTKDGELAKSDNTTALRDALLLYATRRWVHVDRSPPSRVLSLNLIDFGESEVQEGDGKTVVEQRREPLYLPLEEWGKGDGFALTDSGDVRLLIKQPTKTDRPRQRKSRGKKAKRRRDKHEEKERSDSSSESEDDLALDDEEVALFLDVYGEDPFAKVQRLMDSAMQENPPPSQLKSDKAAAPAGTSQQDRGMDLFAQDSDNDTPDQNIPDKQLFWFDLKGWNNLRNDGVIQPIYNKKPIHGTKSHQRQYHKSFFHPDKDRLIGIPGYSLLDKFEGSEGAYAIPGVQRKLNFLMHGPPGTGKSKFVRTAAMYLQRHVVSFSLGQVETEGQWLTLLDSLKTITDDAKKPANNMSFDDVIFVIEELDTDPRGLCIQREQSDEPLPTVADESADSDDQEEPPLRKGRGNKAKGKKTKPKDDKPSDPPLSLGAILRQLDGGSEAPGRLMVMTTNREEKLDAAFKRPGRVKKVRMDNLAFREFKLMILHFLPSQETGSPQGHQLPTVELWTDVVEELAQLVMKDFDELQKRRQDDLDTRGLGLSPAMLEDCCINAECLQDLFDLLSRELADQWAKAKFEGEPRSAMPISLWDWRVHSLRVAVMYHLKGEQLATASARWPPRQMVAPTPDEIDLSLIHI